MGSVLPHKPPESDRYDLMVAEQRRRESLCNIEIEQAFLGCLLRWNQVLAASGGRLEPEHFSEAIHARIFEAASSLVAAGREASEVTLKNYFTQDDTLLQIGGIEYLTRLASAATAPISAPNYARVIRELALRRTAVRKAEQAIDDLYCLPIDLPPETFVAGLAQEFSALAGEDTSEQTRFSACEVAALAIDSCAAAYQGGGDPDAFPSGLNTLDARTGGLCRGDLVIVGARPSMGKTALALALLVGTAMAGLPGVFFSLEMRAKRLGHRVLSMLAAEHGKTSYSRIGTGRVSEAEFSHLVDAGRRMTELPLIIEDRSAMTVAMVSAAVSLIKIKQPKLALVVVDYLGLITFGDRYRGRKVDELAEVSKGLKEIAKRNNVCLLALHQLSRGTEGRENKRPMLSDLRESGAIEQDADVVIFPFREAYYLARELEAAAPMSDEAITLQDKLRAVGDTIELIIAKNRQGAIGIAKLRADMATNVFRDFDTTQESFL